MSVRKEIVSWTQRRCAVCALGRPRGHCVLGLGKKVQCRGSASTRPEIEKIWACAPPRTRARTEAGTTEWQMMLCRGWPMLFYWHVCCIARLLNNQIIRAVEKSWRIARIIQEVKNLDPSPPPHLTGILLRFRPGTRILLAGRAFCCSSQV
jgi:hypothetical protein